LEILLGIPVILSLLVKVLSAASDEHFYQPSLDFPSAPIDSSEVLRDLFAYLRGSSGHTGIGVSELVAYEVLNRDEARQNVSSLCMCFDLADSHSSRSAVKGGPELMPKISVVALKCALPSLETTCKVLAIAEQNN